MIRDETERRGPVPKADSELFGRLSQLFGLRGRQFKATFMPSMDNRARCRTSRSQRAGRLAWGKP